jgi:hypothetical protein
VKKKTIIIIAACVIAAHAILFYFVAGWNPLPRVPYIPPPNFSLGWAKFNDPATHDKMVYQEFTVSTQLDKPAAPPEQTPSIGSH